MIMREFSIDKPNSKITSSLQSKVDNLTKPKGSLGLLEELAVQVGTIQQSLTPTLRNPHHVLFAADHGIAEEQVSFSPQEVTRQMVFNFQQGGAGINFFARQHNIAMELVDVGVMGTFAPEKSASHRHEDPQRRATTSMRSTMTNEECERTIECGAEITDRCFQRGCNVISFGEMGITNTSSSAIWMSLLTGIPLRECIGAGSDHTGGIVEHKYNVLSRAMENYNGDNSPLDVMRYFGGYEMVATVGAMLRAAEHKMVILVDGFIMTACVLMAQSLYPHLGDYCIYGHQGDEAGHKLALQKLGAKPILHLGLRLGEGTGALCAYPIVDSAVRMINEMSSFEKQSVTKYF